MERNVGPYMHWIISIELDQNLDIEQKLVNGKEGKRMPSLEHALCSLFVAREATGVT